MNQRLDLERMKWFLLLRIESEQAEDSDAFMEANQLQAKKLIQQMESPEGLEFAAKCLDIFRFT